MFPDISKTRINEAFAQANGSYTEVHTLLQRIQLGQGQKRGFGSSADVDSVSVAQKQDARKTTLGHQTGSQKPIADLDESQSTDEEWRGIMDGSSDAQMASREHADVTERMQVTRLIHCNFCKSAKGYQEEMYACFHCF